MSGRERQALGAWLESLGQDKLVRDEYGITSSVKNLTKSIKETEDYSDEPLLDAVYEADSKSASYVEGWGGGSKVTEMPLYKLEVIEVYPKCPVWISVTLGEYLNALPKDKLLMSSDGEAHIVEAWLVKLAQTSKMHRSSIGGSVSFTTMLEETYEIVGDKSSHVGVRAERDEYGHIRMVVDKIDRYREFKIVS